MTSKRELERRIEGLNTSSKKYPNASLCQLLSSEAYEVVDTERAGGVLVRLDYGVFHLSDSLVETLTED